MSSDGNHLVPPQASADRARSVRASPVGVVVGWALYALYVVGGGALTLMGAIALAMSSDSCFTNTCEDRTVFATALWLLASFLIFVSTTIAMIIRTFQHRRLARIPLIAAAAMLALVLVFYIIGLVLFG